MARPGQQLRACREQLGLSLREVTARSAPIAAKYGKQVYCLPANRVWEIEHDGVVPSIYRLYSFSIIYRRAFEELLSLYGIDLNEGMGDCGLVAAAPRTHLSTCTPILEGDGAIDELDTRTTTRIGNRIGRGIRSLFPSSENGRYSYGYIGTEDATMSPMLRPGTLVQLDESCTTVSKGPWNSEYERPVYFIETRLGYRCGWCTIRGDLMILQPHPLSLEAVRWYRHPQEAEVIGRVVGAVVQFPITPVLGIRSRTLL